MSDAQYEFQKELTAASVKSQAQEARKGWLFRILPLSLILLAVAFWAIQLATGIPLTEIFSGDEDPTQTTVDPKTGKTTKVTYSSSKIFLARGILLLVVLLIVYFLVSTYRSSGGFTGLLLGKKAAMSPITDVTKISKITKYKDAANNALLIESHENFQDKLPSAVLDQAQSNPAKQMAIQQQQVAMGTPVMQQQQQQQMAAPPMLLQGPGETKPTMLGGGGGMMMGGGGGMGPVTLG